ncbi:MAG TPA: TetR/AcrR family transcriptional regulator [bacterium (Candidatus Stahlbacteria)]|nr:TetR/AcrR family transcriptional regulator [Candidatus Stahlbacteria bacterium]
MKKIALKERKGRILSVARQVFAENGYKGAVMEEVAKRSGLGKGTVYRTFKSKEKLFFTVFGDALSALEETMFSELMKEETAMGKLKRATKLYLKFFEKNKDLFKILVYNAYTFEKNLEKKVRKRYLPYIQYITEIIEEGIKDGELKEIEDVEGSAFALMGVCNGLIYRWLIAETKRSLMDDFLLIEDIYFKGVRRK